MRKISLGITGVTRGLNTELPTHCAPAEAHTPVAAMWQQMYGNVDKTAHMKSMFDLTTRMNALARLTVSNSVPTQHV